MLSSLRRFSAQGCTLAKHRKYCIYSHCTLPDTIIQVQNTTKEFAKKHLQPIAASIDREGRFPQNEICKLGELGLLAIAIPKQWNGSNLNTLALAVAVEELSQGCASTGVIVSIHNCLYMNLLNDYASDAQKEQFLKPYTQGILGCFALSEPDAGSDVASMKTTARREGDKYILNGSKSWVTSASASDLAIVFATIDSRLKHKGISAFLVPLKSKGVTLGASEDKMGIRGAQCCTLSLDGVEVPETNILGGLGEGFKIAMLQLQQARIGIAAQALGIAQSALNCAVDYADSRCAFGQPLSKFQMVKSRIAEVALNVESARLLVRRAAVKYDADRNNVAKESSMAKVAASHAANFAAYNAVQILGGLGFVKNVAAERHFRDARVTEIYGGVTDIQKLIIADAVIADRKNNA